MEGKQAGHEAVTPLAKIADDISHAGLCADDALDALEALWDNSGGLAELFRLGWRTWDTRPPRPTDGSVISYYAWLPGKDCATDGTIELVRSSRTIEVVGSQFMFDLREERMPTHWRPLLPGPSA